MVLKLLKIRWWDVQYIRDVTKTKPFFFFFISLPYETYRKDEKVKNKKLKKSDI